MPTATHTTGKKIRTERTSDQNMVSESKNEAEKRKLIFPTTKYLVTNIGAMI